MIEAGEMHNAATVILISDENPPRTLLIKHKKLKSWLPPGGHQDNGEMPNETAIREVREETGLDITGYLPAATKLDDMAIYVPNPSYVLFEQIPAYKDIPAHIHQDLIYQVKVPFQEPIRAETEHEDISWFREDQIDSLGMIENARKLVLDTFAFFNSLQESEE